MTAFGGRHRPAPKREHERLPERRSGPGGRGRLALRAPRHQPLLLKTVGLEAEKLGRARGDRLPIVWPKPSVDGVDNPLDHLETGGEAADGAADAVALEVSA